MTYHEFRRYGFISRLSKALVLHGPETKPSENIAASQTTVASQSAAESEADRAQRIELQKPLIDKEKALATGDRSAALAAAMPTISQISRGYGAAKDSIFNAVAPGAARDKALADLEVNKSVNTAGAMAGQVQQAPEILANIGSGLGAFSLQELGASLSGYSGASSTEGSVMQTQNAAKASTMGFLGDLAGAGGKIASAGIKPSDRRLKTNVQPLLGALEKLARIQPVTFDYTSGKADQIGVIAQEVLPEFPQAVIGSEGNSFYKVDYAMLIPVALQAIRELLARVEALEAAQCPTRDTEE